MNIREKIKNKIKSRKGMSIGEVLASVLIMLLATGVLTTTVDLAYSKYLRTLSASEANVLASTIETLMTSELAYTTEIHATNGTVTKFQSQNYNTATSLSMFAIQDGKMMITYPDDSSKQAIKLLGDGTENGSGNGSYPNSLRVSQATESGTTKPLVTYRCTDGKGIFTVSFSIERNSETILTRTFNVININNTVPTT